jgi:predicted phosphoribosyltransferase
VKTVTFKNRHDAGYKLAMRLVNRGYQGENILVIGMPRDGLVVADEVAKILSAVLDVIIVRKLRAPYQPELGIGAVVDGDHVILYEELVHTLGVGQDYLSREIAYQKEEGKRGLRFYRDHRPPPEISGKTVIVVDDGIATEDPFRASLESLRQRHPERLVAAAPVAAREAVEMLSAYADEIICLKISFSFYAVSTWYQKSDRVSDEKSAAILQHNWFSWPLAA